MLKIKIFQDGADIASMRHACQSGLVQGFTTNPSLMRKAGVSDYRDFAQRAIAAVENRPISFEVLADDLSMMAREAEEIASWGRNIYVKIPVGNTQGESTERLIHQLSRRGISLNVTAITTVEQIDRVADCAAPATPIILSVFAGRIADTGVDPVPIMRHASGRLQALPKAELMWASTRELLNVVQAEASGCDIITLTPEILIKLPMLGRDLARCSLDAVEMFYADALSANYRIVGP